MLVFSEIMRVAGAVCANLRILARPVAQLATYMYIVLESVCNGSIGGHLGDCEMISEFVRDAWFVYYPRCY